MNTTPAPPMGSLSATAPINAQGTQVNPNSAATAHKAVVQIALMLLFVIVAVMIAGISDGAGDATAAFMFGLLVIQGITNGQALANFLSNALGA